MAVEGTVTSVGYLTIRTTDLTASITDAVDILGLRLIENTGKKAFLAAANTHHEVVYVQDEQNAIDHFAVSVDNANELAAIRAKVDARGYPIVSEGPIEDHIEQGFAFLDPDGFTWQVYVALPYRDDALRGGIGPNRYGHINYRVPNPETAVEFLTSVFNARISDVIGNGEIYFLRVTNEHHNIAVGRNALTGLHHHAWAAQNISDLGRLGDRLARQDRRLLHGPLRHGAGNNIAAYYVEPSGGVVELYTDMEWIFDKDREPHRWDREDLYWVNQWDGLRNPDLVNHHTAPLDRGIRFTGR